MNKYTKLTKEYSLQLKTNDC